MKRNFVVFVQSTYTATTRVLTYRSPRGVLLRTKYIVGVAFCTCAAALLSIAFKSDPEVRLGAPSVCLLAIIMASFLWGRLAGILGGAAATVTFSLLLFPPVGSLRVNDPQA